MVTATRSGRTPSQVVSHMQDGALATGDGVEVDVSGMQKGVIEVNIGTSGTVVFEGTVGGSLWTAVRGLDLSDATETWVTSVTADKAIQFDVSGLVAIRARITAVSGALEVWGHFWG